MPVRQLNLKAITSLRFFASAAIVIFHMQGVLIPGWYAPCLALGVSFFFVLSGFILTYSYSHRFEIRQFYVSRIARLWPVHLTTLLIAIPVADQSGAVPSLTNALLLQAWIPVVGYVFSLNAVSWSISAEVLFYALFPVLRGRFLEPAIWITVALTVGILLGLDLFAKEIWPPVTPPMGQFYSAYVVLQFPMMRLLEFCVGMVAGRIFVARKIGTNTSHELAVISLAMVFAIFSQPIRTVLSDHGFSHTGLWVSQSSGAVIFAALIYVFAHERGWISCALKARPLVFLGEISFSTYMLHQIVSRYLATYDLNSIPLYLGVTYAGSYLLWMVIEKPGKRGLEKALSRPNHVGGKASSENSVGIDGFPTLNVQNDRLAHNATDLN
ncbi:acyltransferase family protein [Phyllobacterium ifriqiyense]|uniref:acyltransferase family protein n=1 Tax=Phyllobacterium ifriqiyense TaxID=314238 RepID=UPI00339AF49A